MVLGRVDRVFNSTTMAYGQERAILEVSAFDRLFPDGQTNERERLSQVHCTMPFPQSQIQNQRVLLPDAIAENYAKGGKIHGM